MNRQDIINNIMANYDRFGVTPDAIEENIRDGEKQGFSYLTIYTGLRMALASAFGTEEYFTPAELAEALGSTEDEILQEIEHIRENIASMGLNPDDYAYKVNPDDRKSFIVPPGYLN